MAYNETLPKELSNCYRNMLGGVREWVYGSLMTKKHFIAIASILRVTHASDEMISLFDAYFYSQFPGYDSARFREACRALRVLD